MSPVTPDVTIRVGRPRTREGFLRFHVQREGVKLGRDPEVPCPEGAGEETGGGARVEVGGIPEKLRARHYPPVNRMTDRRV